MPPSFDIASRYAMQLSLMEIGLGSFLHSFHIPFSGFLLSLNQCFVLNRALLHPQTSPSSSPFLPMAISNTAAIMKTLSPFGKKFTPMLALSMQGLLFNIGALIFGKNILGRCIGSLLLSLWPMVQPLLIYGIIYGSFLFDMSDFYNQMMAKLPLFNDMDLQTLVLGFILVHMALSLGVCFLTCLLPARILDSYDRLVMSYCPSHLKTASVAKKSTFLQKCREVLKDFMSPFFLISLILSGIFFYATLHSLEAFFFSFFRLIALAFLTFFLIRNISIEWCIRIFSKLPFLKYHTPHMEDVLSKITAKNHACASARTRARKMQKLR